MSWLISGIAILLGIAQVIIVYLVNKANKLQDDRFKDIKEQIKGLGKFKDDVLASYPTREELAAQRNDCRENFSNIFERLRDLEKGGS